MSKRPQTRRQKANIELAREWYASMQAGVGTPLNKVPYIRELLEAAGTDAAALDPTGARTVADMERELDEAYARGEQIRQEAWREFERERESRTGSAAPKPGGPD